MAFIVVPFIERMQLERITVEPDEPICLFFQQESEARPVVEAKKGSYNLIDYGIRDAKLKLRQTTPVIVQGHVGGEWKTLLIYVTVQ